MKLWFLVGLAAVSIQPVPVSMAWGAVPDHAVILMYHHVSATTPASTSVDPDLFEAHLDYLEENGFRVWPLDQVVDSLGAGRALPDSVVVFTFDDGYRSVYEEAYPRLRQRGWPFTVFVTTDAIDHRQGPVLTWDQLREMAGQGATIASHPQHHQTRGKGVRRRRIIQYDRRQQHMADRLPRARVQHVPVGLPPGLKALL